MGQGLDLDFNEAHGPMDFASAIKADDVDAVLDFIRCGADPAAPLSRDWHTPLSLAVHHRAEKVFDCLIADDRVTGSINHPVALRNQGTALFFAIEAGDLYMTQTLIKKGAYINAGRIDGSTPIFSAVYEGTLPIVRLLIESGADVNKSFDKDGETPLSLAAGRGHARVVALLLESGANVSTVNRNDESAAHQVASIYKEEAALDVIEVLFRAGADINGQSKDGLSPYDMAEWKQNKRMMNKIESLLAEKGQKPHVSPKNLDFWGGWGWFS